MINPPSDAKPDGGGEEQCFAYGEAETHGYRLLMMNPITPINAPIAAATGLPPHSRHEVEIMARQTIILIAVLLLTVISARSAELTFEAREKGIKVSGDNFYAEARTIRYDDAKGVLILIGPPNATFVRIRNGKESGIQANEIRYWPKTDRVSVGTVKDQPK